MKSLFDLDAPEAVAHVGLIDVAKLQHSYNAQLGGFEHPVGGAKRAVDGG